MPDRSISAYFNYKPLKNYIGLEGSIPIKHKDVFVGVEVEVERVFKHAPISSITVTEDGSLKLQGYEFITIPMKFRYLEIELKRLLEGIKYCHISKRCSVHVHINMRDMMSDEIKGLVLIYMLYERLLFRFSGNRWPNIFCTPLYNCPKMVHALLWNDPPTDWKWQKYTAMNLKPIWGEGATKGRLGTIEFRQMEGSLDANRIVHWINLLTSLKRWVQHNTLDEIRTHLKVLDVTERYTWLTEDVFGDWAHLLYRYPTFEEDLKMCLLGIKNHL